MFDPWRFYISKRDFKICDVITIHKSVVGGASEETLLCIVNRLHLLEAVLF